MRPFYNSVEKQVKFCGSKMRVKQVIIVDRSANKPYAGELWKKPVMHQANSRPHSRRRSPVS